MQSKAGRLTMKKSYPQKSVFKKKIMKISLESFRPYSNFVQVHMLLTSGIIHTESVSCRAYLIADSLIIRLYIDETLGKAR